MIDSKDKRSYLIKEATPEKAFDMINEKLKSDFRCLCVSRSNPDDLKLRYGADIPMIWLNSQSKTAEAQDAANVAILKSKISSFLKKNKKSIVLLDRLDYLVNMNGFSSVLKMIYVLNDEMLENKATLIVNVNPATLSSQELSLLEQELSDFPMQKAATDDELEDDIYEILAFVNNNDKVSFKRIGKEFMITKTTTRKRVGKLLEKKLVSVKKNGRNKIVQISDSGKKYL